MERTEFCLSNAIRLCNIVGINDFAIPSERELHHTNILSWKWLKVLIFIICILAINQFSSFVCFLRVRTSEKYVLFRRPG
jgi:hypothetical protein